MNEEEIFKLSRIGCEAALKVTKAIVGANVALARFSQGLGNWDRDIGSQFYSGPDECVSDGVFGFAGLTRDIGQGQAFSI